MTSFWAQHLVTIYVNMNVWLLIFSNFKTHYSELMKCTKITLALELSTFESILKQDTRKEILNIDGIKAAQNYDIPLRIIEQNTAVFTEFLFCQFSKSLEVYEFSRVSKHANITFVLKKSSCLDKNNCCPVSILSLPTFQKLLKSVYLNKSLFVSKIFI